MHTKLSYKKIIFYYIIALIPLLLYGIYKNGLLLYQKELIPLYQIFKPLYLVIISIILYLIINIMKNKKINVEYNIISYLIMPLIVMPNINYIYFILSIMVILIIDLLLSKRIIFNKVALFQIIIIIISFIFKSYTYKSLLDTKYNFAYNILDIFCGRQVGGIASTSIILVIIAFIFLSVFCIYKKEISVSIIVSYLIGLAIFFIITKQININMLINSTVIFASVFVATDSISSPYSKRLQYVYGTIIGIITLVFVICFKCYDGIYIAIFISSLLLNITEKGNIVQKK